NRANNKKKAQPPCRTFFFARISDKGKKNGLRDRSLRPFVMLRLWIQLLRCGSPAEMHDEGYQEQHEEYVEEDLSDPSCGTCNSPKSECSRYQPDHNKR